MRNLTSGFRTAAAADVLRVGLIAEIDYPDVPLRAWTGPTTLTWGGHDWLGVGDLGGISAVSERTKTEAPSLTLEISGISSTNLAHALAETSQKRRATAWLALFELDGGGNWTIIADPWRLRRGWTDVHKLLVGAKTARVSVTVESILARLKIARTMRYTDADQQRLFPGDTAGRFAGSIGEKPIYWGTSVPAAAAAPIDTGGGGGDNNGAN
jgi:hypothetical protein